VGKKAAGARGVGPQEKKLKKEVREADLNLK
jgi:hypothetical protein